MFVLCLFYIVLSSFVVLIVRMKDMYCSKQENTFDDLFSEMMKEKTIEDMSMFVVRQALSSDIEGHFHFRYS